MAGKGQGVVCSLSSFRGIIHGLVYQGGQWSFIVLPFIIACQDYL